MSEAFRGWVAPSLRNRRASAVMARSRADVPATPGIRATARRGTPSAVAVARTCACTFLVAHIGTEMPTCRLRHPRTISGSTRARAARASVAMK